MIWSSLLKDGGKKHIFSKLPQSKFTLRKQFHLNPPAKDRSMFALKRPLLNAVILSALLAGGAAVPAFADSVAPSIAKTGQDAVENSAQHAEARIKTLHDALKVTAAQETQWAPIAQIMRDNG